MSTHKDQPPLEIKLDFHEALDRFCRTDPKELKARLDAIPKRPRKPNKKPKL